jgi:hypothetical protein
MYERSQVRNMNSGPKQLKGGSLGIFNEINTKFKTLSIYKFFYFFIFYLKIYYQYCQTK